MHFDERNLGGHWRSELSFLLLNTLDDERFGAATLHIRYLETPTDCRLRPPPFCAHANNDGRFPHPFAIGRP